MKKLIAAFLFVTSTFYFSNKLRAQEVAEKIDALQSLKFTDWQNTFRNYFAEQKAQGITEKKGTGFNQVSRMLWFHRDRLDPDGNIVNTDVYNWNAYQQFVKENQMQPFASVSPQTAEWNYASPYNIRNVDGKAAGIGRVIFVKLDPNDASNATSAAMYVGSPKGGLWKTTFNKTTGLTGAWSCLTDGLPNIGAVDLCIHPSNRNIMYLVSGDKNAGIGNSPSGIGILKTTDGGASWYPTNFFDATPPTFEYGTIRKLLMDNSNPNQMWAATTAGIIRTTDGWQTFTNEVAGSFWDLEKGRNSSNQNLVACTNSRVYTSPDYGNTWTAVKNNAGTGDYSFTSIRAELAVSADFGSNRSFYLWYVNGTSSTTTSSIKLYAGSSLTWSDKYSGTDLVHVYKDYCMAFETSQVNSNFVYAGGVTLKQSDDAGSTWIDINAGVPGTGVYSDDIHADQHYMAWDQGHLFLGNDGGVYNYNYGLGGWRYLSDGMHISQYYRIGYNNNANGFKSLAGAQDMGTHSQSTRIGCCDGMESLINYNDIKTFYTSRQNAVVVKTTDGGTNFSNFGPAGFQNDNVWITPMAMHKTNPDIVALAELNGSSGALQIYNGSWSEKATATAEFRWIAFAKSAPNVLYGITDNQIVKVSDVTAATPTITKYTLPVSGATCVAVDPNNSAHIFYTVGGYTAITKVYQSINSGQTWTQLTLNLPNVPVNCILMGESASDDLYIGTDIGVFVKLASWSYWAPFMNGLPNTRVTDLEIGGGLLTCATYGRGRWFTNLYGDCAATLDLTVANDPVTGPITGYQYYTASSAINSSRVVQGVTGTDVTYRAGGAVTLKEGFHAKVGNDFKAILGPCFPGGPAPMNVGTDPAIIPFINMEPKLAETDKPNYDYMHPPIIF